MPVLTITPLGSDRIDPDGVSRPVVTVGLSKRGAEPIVIAGHRHRKGQFLLVRRGAISCEVERGLWIVPPGSAIWIPGGAYHAVSASGPLEGCNAFIDPTSARHLPSECRVIAVTPLLRELLVRFAKLPLHYPRKGTEARMAAVLLDEIAQARREDLHLSMPQDVRLRTALEAMMAAPGRRSTAATWAHVAGYSERTFTRRIRQETGMSIDRWRRQMTVVLAVRAMVDGQSIQRVAAMVGYESVPSFVAMFRKVTGLSPRRYMTERQADGGMADR